MPSYSTLLYYKGYCISVDNWIYRIVLCPFKKYIRLNDVKKEIDRLEEIQKLTYDKN